VTGTNLNPKHFEKRTSERTKKHAGKLKLRRTPQSRQKKRRSAAAKEKALIEKPSECRWDPRRVYLLPRKQSPRSEFPTPHAFRQNGSGMTRKD
jgi:hypothetical protein